MPGPRPRTLFLVSLFVFDTRCCRVFRCELPPHAELPRNLKAMAAGQTQNRNDEPDSLTAVVRTDGRGSGSGGQ